MAGSLEMARISSLKLPVAICRNNASCIAMCSADFTSGKPDTRWPCQNSTIFSCSGRLVCIMRCSQPARIS